MKSRDGPASLLRSGVAPIDERLGGLTPGKPYLLTGPPGSGKTTVCLAFIGHTLADGRSAALLTQDDPDELLGHAADIGVDLTRAAASGRFVLVRFRPDFVARFEGRLSAAPLVDELVDVVGPGAPDRLVVDSVIPFLDAGGASGLGMAALVQVLERLRSTALVTYPGDVRDYYDRRLDALVRRCAALMHLSSHGEGIGRMDVVKSRARLWSDAPSFFAVRRGEGIVAFDDRVSPTTDISSAPYRRHLLVIAGADGLPEELLAALAGSFSVTMHEGSTVMMSDGVAVDVGAVIVAARWDAFTDAGIFLRELRQSGNRTPVILVTRGDVRSSDLARAVLAGFDEVISDAARPDEIIARVTAVARRGRSFTMPDAALVNRLATPLPPPSPPEVLDDTRFRAAVEAAGAVNDGLPFSVLLMTTTDGDHETLSTLVARTIRAGSGDLVGIVGQRVGVFLRGTRHSDATWFFRRVSSEWNRAGYGDLAVTQLAYPADRDRLRAALQLKAPLPSTV